MGLLFDESEENISAAQNAQQALSKNAPADALSIIRAGHLNRPFLVVFLGQSLLSKSQRLPPKTYWDIASDVCRAASECGAVDLANNLLQQLTQKFPKSSRRVSLAGIVLEAQAYYDRAMRLYMEFIDSEPLSSSLYKRQVAILKAQLKWNEAIALLNYYLSLYSQDTQAWAELCAICLRLGRMSHAIFAATELVMNDPRNHAYHTLLADVYFTSGGHHNINMARRHYTASVNLRQRGNLRALFGLWLCSTLHSNPSDTAAKTSDSSVSVSIQMRDHTRNAINAVYSSIPHPPSGLSYIQSFLGKDSLQ